MSPPPFRQEFEDLLSLVKKQRAIISSDLKYLTAARDKYKTIWENILKSEKTPIIDSRSPKKFRRVMDSISTQPDKLSTQRDNQDFTEDSALFKKTLSHLSASSHSIGFFSKIQQITVCHINAGREPSSE